MAENEQTPQQQTPAVDPEALRFKVRKEIMAEIAPLHQAELDELNRRYGTESQSWGEEKKRLRAENAELKALKELAEAAPDLRSLAARRAAIQAAEDDIKAERERLARERAEQRADSAVRAMQEKYRTLTTEFLASARQRILQDPAKALFIGWEAEELAAKTKATPEAKASPNRPTAEVPASPVAQAPTVQRFDVKNVRESNKALKAQLDAFYSSQGLEVPTDSLIPTNRS